MRTKTSKFLSGPMRAKVFISFTKVVKLTQMNMDSLTRNFFCKPNKLSLSFWNKTTGNKYVSSKKVQQSVLQVV